MKLSNTAIFWILQCFGWGTLALFNTLFKLVKATHLDKTYTIFEGFLFIIVAIFCTSLFRYYLKKKVSFNRLNLKEVIKILISFIITVILFSGTIIILAKILYALFHENSLQIDTSIILSNTLNTIFYILLWFVCYRVLKMTVDFRKNEEERLFLEATLKESELNTLKGQINPHFMFNSLNNIRGLILEDVEKSREMITRLSEMLRYSLTKNKVDTITLKEELEMVDNYIELSKIQFENRLMFTSKVEDNLLNVDIPPMIIQMLIENALKHGISNLREGGNIDLSILETNRILKINVTNSGTLIETKSTTKVGLENIKKRLHLLYKDKANFNLKEENKNVIATIKLPI
ncbi:histidine kinase [Lacinutrix sp.]|uniref:sensor histidine kinase n=1 Tax=Lacinutrix sp. TaxID=1937692 RepID=UPI0025C46B00|nr:histidine kinase [Lacinutrix sp.]